MPRVNKGVFLKRWCNLFNMGLHHFPYKKFSLNLLKREEKVSEQILNYILLHKNGEQTILLRCSKNNTCPGFS